MMGHDVIISIRPKWCEKIVTGEKTVEVRKSAPKPNNTPFKCYIYCSKHGAGVPVSAPVAQNRTSPGDTQSGVTPIPRDGWSRRIFGAFICDKVSLYPVDARNLRELALVSCVSEAELRQYADKRSCIFGWHITDLKIYDKAKPITDFGMLRPPRSWCYIYR